MHSPSESPPNYSTRLRRAESIRAYWHAMCDPEILHYVHQYSNAIGCQEEHVFFPLLSLCASAMSPNAKIEITEHWNECPSLWFALCSRNGEGKTSVLKLLRQDPTVDNGLNTIKDVTFNAEDLLNKHERRHLALSEDLSIYLNCNNNRIERLILSSMYNGKRPTDGADSSLNITGFIEVSDMVDALSQDELKPITNQFLYICAQERQYFMEDLIPVVNSTSSIAKILKIIRELHEGPVIYKLSPQAKEMLNDFLNELIMHRRSIANDQNKRYVLSLAKGQFCRLVMVSHVLKMSLNEANNESDGNGHFFTDIIKVETVRYARECMNYLLDMKLNLMPDGGECVEKSESPKLTKTPERISPESLPVTTGVLPMFKSFPFNYTSPTMVPPFGTFPTNTTLFPFPNRTPESTFQERAQSYMNCRQRTPVVQGVEMNGAFHYDFSNLLPWAAKNLRSLLTSGHPEISASIVAGRHLMPPTKTPGTENRYKTGAAIAYLYSVADLGFGSIYRTNKRSVVFKKTPYDQLSQDAKDILTKIQVTEEAYSRVKVSLVDEKRRNEESPVMSMRKSPIESQIPSMVRNPMDFEVPMDLRNSKNTD